MIRPAILKRVQLTSVSQINANYFFKARPTYPSLFPSLFVVRYSLFEIELSKVNFLF
jgi:hypothetical protein